MRLKISKKKYEYFCLHGDFNSRSSEEPDFIDFDRLLYSHENVEHWFIDTCNVYMLEELGIPLRRANEDNVIARNGKTIVIMFVNILMCSF